MIERVDCKKVPRKSKLPNGLKRAAKDYAEYAGLKLNDVIFVVKGAPTVEEDEDELRLYRYQLIEAYSKKFQFAKNPCGDDKTFCEVGGSRAVMLYNRVEHALERAAANAGKHPDRCKAQLEEARKQAESFADEREDQVKRKEWVSGASYKTKKGVKLSEKEFLESFAAKGQQAEEHQRQKYCSQPIAPRK